MSQPRPEIQVFDIDHLGIVAGIIDELGLVEAVNELIGSPAQEQVSIGHVIKAMLLNGLGFVSAPLYLFEQFFEGIATEHLIGEGIQPSHLNDDRLGRDLAKFHRYGVVRQASVGLSIMREQKISLVPSSYALPTLRS